MLKRAACIALYLLCAAGAAQEIADAPISFWERATLYRDEWGTPHVYADDFRALGFAFGYAQAGDHLEPMLAAYRIANGRAAEVFGEAYAPSDEFSLKMGHAMLARSAFDHLDAATRDICEGFAMGVNAWIVDHAEQASPWADGVHPADPLALLHCYLMSMAPFDLPGAFYRLPGAITGNAWAVAPQNSATGEPLLAINPHTTYNGPFQWYEAHLVCQDMNMAGATLFGLPLILQGHNDHLGWALSPNQPDFADVYTESFNIDMPRDPKSLFMTTGLAPEQLFEMMIASQSKPYQVWTNEGLVERAVPCLDTPRGPIITIENGRMWSYRIGGYRDLQTLPQLLAMARAHSLTDFQAALAMHQLPCFHVVYADKTGNIFYLYNAKMANKAVSQIPENPHAPDAPPSIIVDWTRPAPGDKPLYEWGDLIPVNALPAFTNPPAGYLQACGTPPWSVTDDTKLDSKSFPEWYSRDTDSQRARRLRRLLAMGKRSFTDCQSILYDISAPLAMNVVPKLMEAADANPQYVEQAHPDLSAVIELLRKWNCLADTTSVEMTLFHMWWTLLNTMRPETLSSQDDLAAALMTDAAPYHELLLNAAADAARMMRNEFNSITIPWGDVHTIKRGEHEVALPGAISGEPMFVASDNVYDGHRWRATYGYAFAMVVAFGEAPRAESILPFGTSENPESPHYADQLALMTRRGFKTAWFQLEDVQRNTSTAVGRIVYLRPKAMEGLVCLRAPSTIEAKLATSTSYVSQLPEGLAPYSLYLTCASDQPDVPVDVALELHVPSVICADDNLDKLAVYACDEYGQWTPLQAQSLDPATRTFFAQDIAPRTYVIAGSPLYRLGELVIPGKPQAKPEVPAAAERPSETVSDAPAVQVRPPHEVPPILNPNAVLVPSQPSDQATLKQTRPATSLPDAPPPPEKSAPDLPRLEIKEKPKDTKTPKKNFSGKKK